VQSNTVIGNGIRSLNNEPKFAKNPHKINKTNEDIPTIAGSLAGYETVISLLIAIAWW
jgi:hypothetical protein